MSLCVGDVLVGREFIPETDIAPPVGEVYIDGAWVHVKFDVGAHFLIVREELLEEDTRFLIQCVVLENGYAFWLRTTLDSLFTMCQVISRECSLL